MLRSAARLSLIVLFVLAVPHALAATDHLTLTILHTNDLHGHVLPFAYQERGGDATEHPSAGGLARRATLLAQVRRSAHNPVVVVDAGDVTTRGPLWTTYLGAPEIAAMNAMHYDMATVGNNEFKLLAGVDENNAAGSQNALAAVMRRSHFPWLCANVKDGKGAMLLGVKPYIVRDIGGVRVGFLGITAPRSREYPQTKGLTFTDPIAAARAWVPKLRAKCDVLIAVTHLGVLFDRGLAATVPGIDAIVGGDSHTFLHQAIMVRNPTGVGVPIVQAGEFGVYVGRMDLDLKRDTQGAWHASVKSYRLLPVGPPLKQDAAVAAAVEPYVKPFRAVIGRRPAIRGTPKECARQTRLLFAEALRYVTKADLAFVTDSGFQGALRNPTITRYDLYSAWAFHDNVVTAELTGAQIAKLRDANAEAALDGAPRILELSRVYRVALVDFGATETLKLPTVGLTATGVDVRDAVIRYLRSGAAHRPLNTRRREYSKALLARRPG